MSDPVIIVREETAAIIITTPGPQGVPGPPGEDGEGGGGSADWGGIGGTLGDQTDLVSALAAKETPAGAQAKVDTHSGDTTSVHGITDTTVLATDAEVAAAVSAHAAAANPHPTYETSAEAQAKVDAEAVLARNADNLTSGTVADARIAGTIARDSEVTTAVGVETARATAAEALAIPLTQKAAVSGVASLDSGGKVPSVQLPAVAITDAFVVASQAAMLALSAERGDVAIRTDLSKSFILATDSPGTLADWKELLAPAGAVSSVNTRTGAVTGLAEQTSLDAETTRATAAEAAAQAASQPLDSDLTAIAALATTSFGRSFLDRVDAAAGRTLLGLGDVATLSAGDFLQVGNNLYDLSDPTFARFNLGLGSAAEADTGDFDAAGSASAVAAASQPVDSDLTAIAALTTTSFGRSFLDRANAAAGRTLLGLGTAATVDTGTGAANVPTITQADARYQASDSDLTAIAALTTTSFGRSFLDRADAAAGRTLLGLGTAATSASTAFIPATIVDAAGDLITATADDTPSRLAKGTAKQILRVNAAATALEYVEPRALVVAEQHADVSFSNSTADNAVATLALPGGAVAVGDTLLFKAAGNAVNNSGGAVTYTFKFKIGATTVVNTGTISFANSPSAKAWCFDLFIVIESVTAQRIGGSLLGGGPNATGLSALVLASSGIVDAAAAEDTSTAKNFIASVTMGTASASASITCREASLVLTRV